MKKPHKKKESNPFFQELQREAQITTQMRHVVQTCSRRSAGVRCPAHWPLRQCSGLRLLSGSVEAGKPPQDPTMVQGPLPTRGRQHPARHQLLNPSTGASQEERWPLATRQHILHCLKYCVPTACPVQYETNLPEEMNRILLLKVVCRVH